MSKRPRTRSSLEVAIGCYARQDRRKGRAKGEVKEEGEGQAMDQESLKEALDYFENEFTCPITNELMRDPVTAEDGRLYDRAGIIKWFATQTGPQAKSPMTGNAMGFRLLNNVQVRNTITRMVEAGAFGSTRAKEWKDDRRDEETIADLYKKAENGDITAMCGMGYVYRDAMYGYEADAQKAFAWFKLAADHGNCAASTAVGIFYLNAQGAEPNRSKGIMYLSMGAAGGSEHAAAVLGWAHDNGHHGFGQDKEGATYWYSKMSKCEKKDSLAMYRDRAAAHLAKYPAGKPKLPVPPARK